MNQEHQVCRSTEKLLVRDETREKAARQGNMEKTNKSTKGQESAVETSWRSRRLNPSLREEENTTEDDNDITAREEEANNDMITMIMTCHNIIQNATH